MLKDREQLAVLVVVVDCLRLPISLALVLSLYLGWLLDVFVALDEFKETIGIDTLG